MTIHASTAGFAIFPHNGCHGGDCICAVCTVEEPLGPVSNFQSTCRSAQTQRADKFRNDDDDDDGESDWPVGGMRRV